MPGIDKSPKRDDVRLSQETGDKRALENEFINDPMAFMHKYVYELSFHDSLHSQVLLSTLEHHRDEILRAITDNYEPGVS